jgi:hypothetical protein
MHIIRINSMKILFLDLQPVFDKSNEFPAFKTVESPKIENDF